MILKVVVNYEDNGKFERAVDDFYYENKSYVLKDKIIYCFQEETDMVDNLEKCISDLCVKNNIPVSFIKED